MSAARLAVQTLQTSVIGLVVLGSLLFLPAGTFDYWQGWLFIVVFSGSTSVIGIYLAVNDPALLARRQRIGPTAEQRPAQRIIISLGILSFVGVLVLSALDHRFGWSPVPPSISLVGAVLVALGLFVDLLVFRTNSYGASNVQVEQGQTVISTGPYAIVRHPMYAGVLIMALGTPLTLGSWWGLVALLITIPVLAWRILDEEALLKDDLPGYAAYTHDVRYRLVPFVW
jgi:protein-S-isoprenylcysteine O-methyltransferase Ste14